MYALCERRDAPNKSKTKDKNTIRSTLNRAITDSFKFDPGYSHLRTALEHGLSMLVFLYCCCAYQRSAWIVEDEQCTLGKT